MKHWAFFLFLMGVVLPAADSESSIEKREGIEDQPKKMRQDVSILPRAIASNR
jgi:hypothetical protein